MKKSLNSEKSSNKQSPSPENKSHIEIKERVRYSETDQMGVAHNKSYLEWFEIGRTEFCRQKNIPYREIESKGYFLMVVEAFCRYKRPLKYDEEFYIRVFLDQVTGKKVVFQYELLSEKERKLIATGYTVHVVTNAKAQVSSLPSDILEKIMA